MDLALAGRTGLIVGASRGIGAATARVLAGEGMRLVLSSRDADGTLANLAAELSATTIAADMTVAAMAEDLVTRTVARLGRLDTLVISIGAAGGGLFWDLHDDVWNEALALKFMGMVRLLRAVAPRMKAQGSGSIVVVVGNNGRQPAARMLPGSAANAACLAVIKGLGDELAPDGVRVNAVNPGPTRTSRWDGLMADLAQQSNRPIGVFEAAYLGAIPSGRINTPEQVARLIAVLASDVAYGMNGTAITIDGGATRGLP